MADRVYKSQDDYSSLVINRILTVVIVSVIPMILASGIILYQFRSSYHEKVLDHLVTLVKKHKQNIDSFLNEKLGDIRVLAQTFECEQMNDEAFLQDRLADLQYGFGPVFVDLGVINREGTQVAYAGPFKLGKAQYSETAWFQNAMKNEYVISDVFLGLRGLPHFIVAVQKRWRGEEWILRATIDFGAFNTLVENIRVGETGFAYIINRDAEFQTKPPLDTTPSRRPYMDLLKGTAAHEIHIFEKKDDTGHKNIYVSAFLKNGDWLLVYQQRSSDVFSDIRKAFRVTLIIILLGAMGSIGLALVRVKGMASRMAKIEQEKQMMNEQIVETGKLASVGELAAGIAHEINNPVAIMVEEAGWIGDLLEEEEFQEGENLGEFRRALDQIRTQGKRCKEITHKLLSFARKTDSRIQDIQLNDLVEEIVALSAQRAKYDNVTINTDLYKDLPLIRVSETELQQVLLNMINNSLDAMKKTGGEINITSRVEGGSVVIEVADTGPGIPAANLPRIFDPFFTTKPVGKGTGLGLSICYGIIKKLGGEIVVHSQLDVGTTFKINLPLHEHKGDTAEPGTIYSETLMI
ncbi:MAG: ATP-binding protein [Thermodesulfobacteriota bacterium]|nr:ATP-binding protein [Thermodesulfobacteriota bacterium]